MLRRITEQWASVREPDDVAAVLDALAQGLVAHGGLAAVQIWLYLRDGECPHCARASEDEESRLHSQARAGQVHPDHMRLHHRLPLGWNGPGVAAATRKPFLINDLQDVVATYRADPEASPLMRLGKNWEADLDWCAWGGFQAGVVYPLIVRGNELVGAFAAIAHRPISDEEFAHLGVFANQAAISIRSAQLLAEANRLRARLAEENDYLQAEIRFEAGFAGIVGQSKALRATQRLIEQVAGTESTVLLIGETGTGKEMVARAIHARSRRANRPLIRVNCGAISPNLVESELFGHERGAFTGAADRRLGRFELASGGTLFLDEVGELPLELQPKLLRVLETKEVRPLGGTSVRKLDCRVVAATNRRLHESSQKGEFRQDLYYRLAVARVTVPPLRDRPDDVLPLATELLRVAQRDRNAVLPSDLAALLLGYRWPGNVRELRNVVERFALLGVRDAPALFDAQADEPGGAADLSSLPYHEARRVALERFERSYLPAVLARAGGVVAKAAELAEVARPSFYRMLDRIRPPGEHRGDQEP